MGGSQKFKYFFNSTLLDHVRKMTVGQYIENKLLYLSDSANVNDEDTYTIIYRLCEILAFDQLCIFNYIVVNANCISSVKGIMC